MVSIMQEIHVLFIKLYVFPDRSKFAHNHLPELLACDEGIISITFMFVGVTGKCWFLMVVGPASSPLTISFLLFVSQVQSAIFYV